MEIHILCFMHQLMNLLLWIKHRTIFYFFVQQVVQFHYWKASEFETAEHIHIVPLSEFQLEKIIRLRAVLLKDLQLAEILVGRINSQRRFDRLRYSFSAVVCEWEAYTLKLRNELVMSLPYWRAHHSIFSAANLDWKFTF